MGRQHRHPGDAGHRQLGTARCGHVEPVVAGRADQPAAVAGHQQLGRVLEAVRVGLRGVAEAERDAVDAGDLGEVGLVRGPDLDIHEG